MYDWVINFSINPKLFSESYSTSIDQDALISQKIVDHTDARFVMISSRTVYPWNNSIIPICEKSNLEIKNQKQYGLNKLKSENASRAILKQEQLLIIRASNIFGFEIGRHTFMGVAQKRLVENAEIILDIDKTTKRDFIPVQYFCQYLIGLIQNDASGIYNVGSGFGLSLDEICSAIICGFGEGQLKVLNGSVVKGQFVLDTTKLIQLTSKKLNKTQILTYAKQLGEQIKVVKNGFK
mgnify:FL=1|jgi:nucleoside-diphosphate-sugar epimerase